MEIIIGEVHQINPARPLRKKPSPRTCEAKILNVRSSRKRLCGLPYGQRNRRKNNVADPSGGRVVTLMVKNGQSVPADLNSGKYKAVIKFIPMEGTEKPKSETPFMPTDIIA